MSDQEIADKVIGRMLGTFSFYSTLRISVGTQVDGISTSGGSSGRVISCKKQSSGRGHFKCKAIKV